MTNTTAFLIALALLFANAFFVGAEFALVSVRRTAIEEAASAGKPGARFTLRAIENVTLMMAGAQLGITMCSLGLGAIAEPAIAHSLEPVFAWARVPEAFVHPVAFVVAMALVVFFHMTIGEMVPKNIAIAQPARSALILGPPMYVIAMILSPLLWLMNGLANLVLLIIRVKPTREVASTITTDEVSSYLAESAEVGLLEENEERLLSGALLMTEAKVREVMVPIERLVWLGSQPTASEAERAGVEHGFSRFPVRDDDGSWLGYLHLKDVLDLIDTSPQAIVPPARIRQMVRVDPETPLPEALTAMQRSGVHFAIVVSDNPDAKDDGVLGVAMLEDVMETMVGRVDHPAPVSD